MPVVNTPTLNDDSALRATVERAKAGDRTSLEIVVIAVQDDVFRLALRMTAHPQDARDASQEILIKIITGLRGFRGESSIRTWAYRIAVRHMLDRQKKAALRRWRSISSASARICWMGSRQSPIPISRWRRKSKSAALWRC